MNYDFWSAAMSAAPLVMRGLVMPTRGPAARPVDLLIASTHEWTSRSLATILAPYGYVVGKTFNRAQTLKRIRTNPPDAVIIDEQLPDGDGYALCRQLTDENLVSPSTPIFLALSRPPTRRDRIAALQASAWACLGERSEEHTSELQSLRHLVCRLLLEKKKEESYDVYYNLENIKDTRNTGHSLTLN